MLKIARRKRLWFYRLTVLAIVIVVVWIICPFVSSEIQIYGIDSWFRIFATIFYGALFVGLIDIRGGLQKRKPHGPYLAPRFFYILTGGLGLVVGIVGLMFYNFIFLAGLFGKLLTIDLIISISVILSVIVASIYGITYYRTFNEWYEELNG
jgi:uncharacterized membrane protein YhdT